MRYLTPKLNHGKPAQSTWPERNLTEKSHPAPNRPNLTPDLQKGIFKVRDLTRKWVLRKLHRTWNGNMWKPSQTTGQSKTPDLNGTRGQLDLIQNKPEHSLTGPERDPQKICPDMRQNRGKANHTCINSFINLPEPKVHLQLEGF